MGFWNSLAGFATKLLPIPGAGFIGDAIGAAGSALGNAADASAQNHGARIDAATMAEQLSQARQRAAMAREQLAMEGSRDARRNAAIADYVLAGGNTKPTGLPAYDFGRRAPGGAEIEVAKSNRETALKRAAAGGTLVEDRGGDFAFNPSDMKASGFEKFANIAAPIATGVGGFMAMRNDPLEGLRAEHPDLSESQLRVIAEVLKEKGVRY